MTLWDIIRDFFVNNIFGGYNSSGNRIYQSMGKSNGLAYYAHEVNIIQFGDYSVNLADWLSTTATIITLILLVAFLYLVVKYIFKVFSGLFRFN